MTVETKVFVLFSCPNWFCELWMCFFCSILVLANIQHFGLTFSERMCIMAKKRHIKSCLVCFLFSFFLFHLIFNVLMTDFDCFIFSAFLMPKFLWRQCKYSKSTHEQRWPSKFNSNLWLFLKISSFWWNLKPFSLMLL